MNKTILFNKKPKWKIDNQVLPPGSVPTWGEASYPGITPMPPPPQTVVPEETKIQSNQKKGFWALLKSKKVLLSISICVIVLLFISIIVMIIYIIRKKVKKNPKKNDESTPPNNPQSIEEELKNSEKDIMKKMFDIENQEKGINKEKDIEKKMFDLENQEKRLKEMLTILLSQKKNDQQIPKQTINKVLKTQEKHTSFTKISEEKQKEDDILSSDDKVNASITTAFLNKVESLLPSSSSPSKNIGLMVPEDGTNNLNFYTLNESKIL